MFQYIILYLIGCLSMIIRKNFFYFLIFIMILFSGLRYQVGTDYETYVNIFLGLQNNIEVGYLTINKIIRYITSKSEILFLFISTIILFNVARTIRDNKKREEMLLMFLGIYYLTYTFNTLRHGLAATFILYAILKKKSIYILIAALFHKISFLFFFVYFFIKRDYSKKTIIILYCFGFLIYFTNLDILKFILENIKIPIESVSYKLQYYTQNYYGNKTIKYGLSLGFFLRFFLIIISLKKRKQKNREFNTALQMVILGNLFILYFNFYPIFLERVANICYLFEIYLLPELLEKHKKRIMIVIIYTLLFYLKLLDSKETNKKYQYIPYQSIYSRDRK